MIDENTFDESTFTSDLTQINLMDGQMEQHNMANKQ